MHNILVPIAVSLLCCSISHGQNALGDGTALDGNTSLQGKTNRRNDLPAGTLNSDLRGSRMLQGRSFNEDIGRYNSVDFQLISDATSKGHDYKYIDALYNSPWYWNNWDDQSAQLLRQGDTSFFNLNFIDRWAAAPRQLHTGRNIREFSHAWNKDAARRFGGEGELEYPDAWTNRQIEQYRLGQVLGSGYQTPLMDTSPIPVGEFRTSDTIGYLAASPLSGVSLETGDQPITALGFSAWDAARAAEDRFGGLGEGLMVQAWRSEENRLDQGSIDGRTDVSEQYNNVLDVIAQRVIAEESAFLAAGITHEENWLESQYSLLQNQLVGLPYLPEDDEEEMLIEPEVEEEAVMEIAVALRHGERISHFSSNQQTRFNELVQLGEEKLAAGEYFLAKRRFYQALQFIPGHPLATAGVGHANIGAGLYLSAGHVLQSLLSFQPEMIDAQYDPQLLPHRIELVRAGVTIRNRLDEERDGGTYAFLLAYIGHQLKDNEMVVQGLEELDRRTDENDPIVPLLKAIWLEQEVIEGR